MNEMGTCYLIPLLKEKFVFCGQCLKIVKFDVFLVLFLSTSCCLLVLDVSEHDMSAFTKTDDVLSKQLVQKVHCEHTHKRICL